MKKFLLLITLTCVVFSALTQSLFIEDFNYATGQLTNAKFGDDVSGGKWKSATTGAPFIQVVKGNLEFPNYYSDPSSNKITLVNTDASSESVYRFFKPVNPGIVYASFLFKLTGAISSVPQYGTNGTFLANFGTSQLYPSATDLKIRQGTTGGTIQFGIAARSLSNIFFLAWIPIDYSVASTHLITFSAERIPGDTNDISRLWVDQPYSTTQPEALAISTVTGGMEASDIACLVFNQNVSADIDAVKVSNSYADVALPLGLTSFNASFNGKKVDLKWTMADERNVKGFSLERSFTGNSFSELVFVAATHTANATYSYSDLNIPTGINAYRIKIVDADGRIRYSQVVTIINKSEITASVYPNPAINNISVAHTKANEGALIRLFNAQGRQVKLWAVTKDAIQTTLSIADLSKGMYVLMFKNDRKTWPIKFLKQ
jgi:hypothetical protein